MRRFLILLLWMLAWPAWADMYPDASNAKLPVARTNLGLGTMATQNATAVAITGGTAALTGGANTLTVTSTGPTWTTSTYGVFDVSRLAINGYPLSDQQGGNSSTFPFVEGLVGAIAVPATAVGNNSGAIGVSGYCHTASPTMNCTGVSGVAGASANGATLITGGNTLATNATGGNSPDNTGFSVPGGVQSFEADINIFHLPGGLAPVNTNVYGFRVVGASTVTQADMVAAGSRYVAAYQADTPGIGMTPHAKWTADFNCNDASTDGCLNIGQKLASGTASNSSQVLNFNATSAASAGLVGTISLDATGTMNIVSLQGTSINSLVLTGATKFGVAGNALFHVGTDLDLAIQNAGGLLAMGAVNDANSANIPLRIDASTLNFNAGSLQAQGTAGATCATITAATVTTKNGLVTHC